MKNCKYYLQYINNKMIIDDKLMKEIEIYIKVQNIHLLKYIAKEEGWDFKELIKLIK